MNSSYFQLKIVNTSNPFVPSAVSKGTIKIDFPSLDSGVIRIVRYQALGLNSGTSPIYISFPTGAFNTSPVISGVNDPTVYRGSSTEFMLPIDVDPTLNGNSNKEFNNPIVIMSGDNLTNGSREINYEIRDIRGNLYNLAAIVLTLDYIPISRYNPKPGDRQVKQSENSELVSRGQFFRPLNNFSSEVPHTGFSNW